MKSRRVMAKGVQNDPSTRLPNEQGLAIGALAPHNEAARSASDIVAAAAVLLILPGFAAYPQDHAHPEQAAEKLGTVHFATSCKPRVAPQFNRAVALLHSFEFGASIRAFNELLAADSTCAMAQWGIALSRW
ncbi:MAG: hypothetical protein ACR2G6_14895, partial [Gemmatimonadaceae bacterium]